MIIIKTKTKTVIGTIIYKLLKYGGLNTEKVVSRIENEDTKVTVAKVVTVL